MEAKERYDVARPQLNFTQEHNVLLLRGALAADVPPSLSIPARGFRVEGLLTPGECAALVAGAKPHLEPVDWEYVKEYRSCVRSVVMSPALATTLATRIGSLWQRDDLVDVRPFGYGTDGVWVLPHELHVVNECMRISAYSTGQQFARHRDSGFVVTDDYRSIFTLLVYLNNDFTGGETVFYLGDERMPVSVVPKTGTAVVFTHDMLHEGLPVVHGVKHVLRTDIMFQRVVPLAACSDLRQVPDFVEAEKQYALSIALQKANKPKESTEAFVRAVELHAKVQSVRRTGPVGAQMGGLTRDAWIQVALRLPMAEVVSMQRVSRYFHSLMRHPRLWMQFFHDRWAPVALDAVKSTARVIIQHADTLSDFWYHCYQYRHLADLR